MHWQRIPPPRDKSPFSPPLSPFLPAPLPRDFRVKTASLFLVRLICFWLLANRRVRGESFGRKRSEFVGLSQLSRRRIRSGALDLPRMRIPSARARASLRGFSIAEKNNLNDVSFNPIHSILHIWQRTNLVNSFSRRTEQSRKRQIVTQQGQVSSFISLISTAKLFKRHGFASVTAVRISRSSAAINESARSVIRKIVADKREE